MKIPLIILFTILFQTIRMSELSKLADLAKEDLNKVLPIKGNRPKPGANLWSDEAVEIATKGPQNGGFADPSGNQVKRPIGYWEQPQLQPSTANQNRPYDQQSFPPVGINRPEVVPVSAQERASKDRNWNNWNLPQTWGSDSSDDWTSSLIDSPSLLPLPSHSWNGNEAKGKGNGWGSHEKQQSGNNWNDQSFDIHGGQNSIEPDLNSWDQISDSQWGFPQSDSIALGSQDQDWNPAPHWSSPSLNFNQNGNQKPVCNCEQQQKGNQQFSNGYNGRELPAGIYQGYPSASGYAPVRPQKQQKQPIWSHWDLPWNTWERGVKDGKTKLKPSDVDSKEIDEKPEEKHEEQAESNTTEQNEAEEHKEEESHTETETEKSV